MRTILTFSVLVLVLCAANDARTSESVVNPDDLKLTPGAAWVNLHGPKRDNISPETGLRKSWAAGGPPLLWKNSDIGSTEFPGYASVTVSEGRVFTAGNVKTGETDQNAHVYVFALNERTGKELWRYRNGAAWTDTGKFPGERGTPTVDGDRVYAFSAVGRLACLKVATGEEIWAKDLRTEYDAELPNWAYAESPFVEGNKVVIWIGGKKASVVALDKMTGKMIWETPSTGHTGNYASMTVFDYAGQRIYANMHQKGLIAVNAETGAQLFTFPHETSWDVMATTPYFFDGKLFVTSGYGTGAKVYRLTVNGNTITPELAWENKDFDNQHGGVVIKNGYVYSATHQYKRQRNWMCISLTDGSVAWENPGIGMGSLTCADGMLYCMSEKEGEVALVNATPEEYKETGRFTLPTQDEGGGVGMYWAHPVVINKKLFLRHGNILYCYDVAEK